MCKWEPCKRDLGGEGGGLREEEDAVAPGHAPNLLLNKALFIYDQSCIYLVLNNNNNNINLLFEVYMLQLCLINIVNDIPFHIQTWMQQGMNILK